MSLHAHAVQQKPLAGQPLRDRAAVMLVLVLALVTTPVFELALEGCGDLLDEKEIQQGIARSVNPGMMSARIICRHERVFVQLKDRALPHAEVNHVGEMPEGLRSQVVVSALAQLAASPPEALDLPIEDLRELAIEPWIGSAKLNLLSAERQPISVRDNSRTMKLLCFTPCELHVSAGVFHFSRGGGDTDFRIAREKLVIPPGGGEVYMRAPSRVMFAAASSVMVLGALADIFGMWGFFLSLGSYTAFTAVSFATWMVADFLLIPVSIVMFVVARLGESNITPYGSGFKF